MSEVEAFKELLNLLNNWWATNDHSLMFDFVKKVLDKYYKVSMKVFVG
jgi:hypothetical protein